MNLAAITDLALVLPPEAKRRFNVLRDAVSDDAAIGSGFSAQTLDKMDDKTRAQKRRGEIKANPDYIGITDDHEAIREQDRLIAEAAATLARLNARAEKHQAVAAPRAALLRDVEAWIRRVAPDHDLVDFELVEPPKLGKSETPATAIDRVRRRLRELDADAHRINSAPFPSSYAKQVAAAHINQLAEAAAPYVGHLVELGGPLIVAGKQEEEMIVWPTKQTSAEVSTAAGGGVAIGQTVDVVGLLAFLFRDQMLAAVSKLVDEESDDKAALTHEQRREQLAVIKTDREAVEQEESFWLWQAYDAGVIVEPRADMTPAAFLMVGAVRAGNRPTGFDHADIIANARRATEAPEGRPTTPGSPS